MIAIPLAASYLANTNAIVTALATSASAVAIAPAAMNGTIGDDPMPLTGYGRRLTVTMTNSAGAYVAASVIAADVLRWRADGSIDPTVVTLTATIPTSAGNATVSFGAADDMGVAQVVAYRIPAQATTAGSFTFGVSELIARPGRNTVCSRIMTPTSSGTLGVRYVGGLTATLTAPAAGWIWDITPERLTAASTAITIYV
jgi:hypothetical protein